MSHEPKMARDHLTNDPLLDHNYDGIKELDNPLPGWWLSTFYIAIVFSAFYFTWHHIIGDGHLVEKRYEQQWAQMQEAEQKKAAAQMASLSDEFLLKGAQDSGIVAAGKEKFTSSCSSCHGPDGGGVIGPNLTDAYWLNGDGKPLSILKIIKEGVTTKGMPAWGQVLSQEDIVKVTSYIISLKGSKPANPKAPQGVKY